MAKITITRPNGTVEYAELTTNKDLAGNDRLTVENAGVVYYAKLDSGVSTHMYVIQPNGRKLYVQKEVKFAWKYTFDGTWENASKMVIPRTGKYQVKYHDDPNDECGGQEKFKKGDKFIKMPNHWYIKGQTNSYDNSYTWDNGEDPDNPEYKEYNCDLDTIEYIGEA